MVNKKKQGSGNTTTSTVVQFPEHYPTSQKPYALIIGINGAIGQALARKYRQTHQVVGIARDIHNADHNFTLVQTDYSEENLPELFTTLQGISENFSIIINCIGVLHNDSLKPEKRLVDLTERSLSHYFYVNATLPSLLIKHLYQLLPKTGNSVFAQLSAMVGSITDNKLGGWYGYRASKASLNMLLKTASVELARTHKHAALVAIHPGTTKSRLSEPFTKTTPPEKLYSAELTAQRLYKLINTLDATQTGHFFHWDGSKLEW